MKIKNKTALVLGSTKGIGKAISKTLCKEGANLVLIKYDTKDTYEKNDIDFIKNFKNHMIIKADLRKIKDIKKIYFIIKKKYKSLDILINNIERGGWPCVHGEYTEMQWNIEIETTLKAKQFIFSFLFPLLKKSKESVVINISSIAGIVGRSGIASLVFNDGYSAANRAISSFTETWARMGAPNIRVNEIMLGFFDTRHGKKTRGWTKVLKNKEKKDLINKILLKRTGNKKDVIKACLFLIKDASYITGSVLRVDGGYVLGKDGFLPMPKGII